METPPLTSQGAKAEGNGIHRQNSLSLARASGLCQADPCFARIRPQGGRGL